MLRSRVQTVKKAQKRKWDVAGMVGVEMYAVKKLDRTWNESTGTTKVGETSGKRSKVSRYKTKAEVDGQHDKAQPDTMDYRRRDTISTSTEK